MAVGEPGVIDVIDVNSMRAMKVVMTQEVAHALALDRKKNKVHAFLPQSHQTALFHDSV
jgi:hypothetical protein